MSENKINEAQTYGTKVNVSLMAEFTPTPIAIISKIKQLVWGSNSQTSTNEEMVDYNLHRPPRSIGGLCKLSAQER